jgi:hypothetical protein
VEGGAQDHGQDVVPLVLGEPAGKGVRRAGPGRSGDVQPRRTPQCPHICSLCHCPYHLPPVHPHMCTLPPPPPPLPALSSAPTSSHSATGATNWMPALLTRMSSRPCASAARATMSLCSKKAGSVRMVDGRAGAAGGRRKGAPRWDGPRPAHSPARSPDHSQAHSPPQPAVPARCPLPPDILRALEVSPRGVDTRAVLRCHRRRLFLQLRLAHQAVHHRCRAGTCQRAQDAQPDAGSRPWERVGR